MQYNSELQQAILRNVPESCQVHLNHRLQSYTESTESVMLSFQDGQTAECDLLIGADGLKSVARTGIPNHFRQGSTEPVSTGSTAYRTLIPAEKLREITPDHPALAAPLNYTKRNLHFITYPIHHGTIVNFAAFHYDPSKDGTALTEPAIRDTTREELVELFSGWGQEAQTVINLVEKPLRWAIQALRPLDTYVSNRVALIGDAAHAMPPHLGAGAGQAIEDAFILGKVITNLNCTPERVSLVLKRYDEIRWPIGNKVLLDVAQGLKMSQTFRRSIINGLADHIDVGMLAGWDEKPLIEAGERAMRISDT